MKIIGIDPGLYGALALYDIDTGALEIEDVPVLNMGKGKAKKMIVDTYGLARVIDNWMLPDGPLPVVWIELVGVRPGEGAVGAFSFGQTVGLIRGICAAHFLTIEQVTPASWKRAQGVAGDKDQSRHRATTLFPKYGGMFARKKDDGRAEAVLIAHYGASRLAQAVAA